MKVLEPGRPQVGWAKEYTCSGAGQGGGGCGAKLLVEQDDVYTWERWYMGRECDVYCAFTCSACGVGTNIERPPFQPQTIEEWSKKHPEAKKGK